TSACPGVTINTSRARFPDNDPDESFIDTSLNGRPQSRTKEGASRTRAIRSWRPRCHTGMSMKGASYSTISSRRFNSVLIPVVLVFFFVQQGYTPSFDSAGIKWVPGKEVCDG